MKPKCYSGSVTHGSVFIIFIWSTNLYQVHELGTRVAQMRTCGCLSSKAHWSAWKWTYKPAIIIKYAEEHYEIFCTIYAKHQESQRRRNMYLWGNQWMGDRKLRIGWVLGLFSKVSCSWPGRFLPALVEDALWCGGDIKGSLECNLPEALCFEGCHTHWSSEHD